MKLRHVVVHFGEGRQFELKVASEPPGRDQARDWFDREFVALECDVASPIGKVLAADRVLGVARYSGENRFRSDPAWAQTYATNAVALLDAEYIRVDVPAYSIGF
jgi:hypothetical protein